MNGLQLTSTAYKRASCCVYFKNTILFSVNTQLNNHPIFIIDMVVPYHVYFDRHSLHYQIIKNDHYDQIWRHAQISSIFVLHMAILYSLSKIWLLHCAVFWLCANILHVYYSLSCERDGCNSQLPLSLGCESSPLGYWNCGFKSRSSHGCSYSSFYVVLPCVDRGLATGWSPVQGVLPTVVKRFRNLTYMRRPRFTKNCRGTGKKDTDG
jgi:hypothetical protein